MSSAQVSKQSLIALISHYARHVIDLECEGTLLGIRVRSGNVTQQLSFGCPCNQSWKPIAGRITLSTRGFQLVKGSQRAPG